ncbi:MAG: hypothetical protein ACOCVY_02055 [Patescibacteria group bacterium]
MIFFGQPVNNVLIFAYPGSLIDISTFCNFMGGGGRGSAGGFPCEVDERNLDKEITYVLKKIALF